MVTIFESCSMDYTSLIHWARRADGAVFTRTQYRDPRYGYKWGAWRQTTPAAWPERARETTIKARLPKAA